MRKKPLGKGATATVYKKTTSFDYGIGIDATQTAEHTVDDILSHLRQCMRYKSILP